MTESTARWQALGDILTNLERAFEASCRMDVQEANMRTYRGPGRPCGPNVDTIHRFERRVDALVDALDKVIDRMTAQRLVREQLAREERDRRKVAA